MKNNSHSTKCARMNRRVIIQIASVKIMAELNDTGTAKAIWQALPISSQVNLWGDEIYFSILVSVELEDGKEVVECGDLGYWPQLA